MGHKDKELERKVKKNREGETKKKDRVEKIGIDRKSKREQTGSER